MTHTSTLDRTTGDPSVDRQPAGASALPVGESITLHRRRAALALVGIGAAATAAAYLWAALAGDAGVLGYLVAGALLPLAVLHLEAWWDARVPLLVADDTGIRLRQGRSWSGLRWDEVDAVTLLPARLPRRDAALDLAVGGGSRRLLALSMVDPADVRLLPETLRALAPAAVEVRLAERPGETADDAHDTDDTEEAQETGADAGADLRLDLFSEEPAEQTPGASPPRRDRLSSLLWAMTRRSGDATADEDSAQPGEPAARADVVMATNGASPAVIAAAVVSEPVPPVTTVPAQRAAPGADEPESAEPATTPVIGPRVAAARARVRLSVDDLADRTRIRPHVIEAIEADDFAVCGGDVYARGHLRVLARVLGIDPAPLVSDYDARYADDPVTARKVFEAELAGPGRSIRTTTGGPRWSVLIGVVLVLVVLWTGARMLVPSPDTEVEPPVRDSTSDTSPLSGEVSDATPEELAARFAGMGERDPAPPRVRTRAPR